MKCDSASRLTPFVVAAVLLGVVAGCAQTSLVTGASGPSSVRSVEPNEEDLTALRSVAARWHPDLPPAELDSLVRLNFHFIYLNALRTDQFLSAPRPDKVARRIVEILDARAQLEVQIRQGWTFCHDGRHGGYYHLVRRVGRTARHLNDLFGEYFTEGRDCEYRLQFRRYHHPSSQFLHFMEQSERLSELLSEELHRYFFSRDPATVPLDAYQRYSVTVLSESLQRLCGLTEKALKECFECTTRYSERRARPRSSTDAELEKSAMRSPQ
jgi:hypothetical protein